MPLATDVATYAIFGVGFGVYTNEEIRRLGVKRITQPGSLDRLMAPIDNGLYDPSMGPIDEHTPCEVCGLFEKYCPGHFGYIELPVLLYNPLFFLELFRILKLICHNCYKFRINPLLAEKFTSTLRSIENGNLDNVLCELEGLEYLESCLKSKTAPQALEPFDRKKMFSTFNTTRNLIALKSQVLKWFFQSSPSKCSSCDAPKLKITRDGYSKFYIHRHSKDVMDKLYLRGIRYRSPLILKKYQGLNDSELDSVDPVAQWNFYRNENSPDSKSAQRIYYPNEVEEAIKTLWENQFQVVSTIWVSIYKGSDGVCSWRSSPDIFFVSVIPVPPNRFRPVNRTENALMENPINKNLIDILQLANQLVSAADSAGAPESAVEDEKAAAIKSDIWIRLQNKYNDLIDNTKGAPAKMGYVKTPGVKQRIEKKEGLFRQKIMGKRVDFAARSVISPDPYISTTEIGIPLVFARTLDYPEPVTDYNIVRLSKMVENGPDIYPGANSVEHEDGKITSLSRLTAERRRAIANTLMKPAVNSHGIFGVKKVHRHLLDGDLLIVNRQPTLHKPSMMTHKAHVMDDGNTIQMHYANCNVYNADFDGDEINLHFLQNEMARAEALTIALNEHQYIVPKDGSPVRGLIQDHILSGILLTQKDTFLTRDQFQQLLYYSVWDVSRGLISVPPPAILKPGPLWTGKQLIGSILDQLLLGREKLNLKSKCAIPEEMWGKNSHEGMVIIRQNQLLAGSLGKNQFGAKPHGLVHSIYELYSAQIAAKLLTALGKLFTFWLQIVGFTCGIDDALINSTTEEHRMNLRTATELNSGVEEAVRFLRGGNTAEKFSGIPDEYEISNGMKKIYNNPEIYEKWEKHIMGVASANTSKIINLCLPAGQIKSFPKNNLSLMTISGAKGSRINFSQISCVLGQQELEGKRVPIMCTNRSLPGFLPYDPSLRAGGYIADRFLTGIRPMEYFFHCMAGREGLIDTAVKTSRSGYLQRCIIKHLESLVVQYDCTVRDIMDGSIVQFQYGEDGIDVISSGYLEKFEFFADNLPALVTNLRYDEATKLLEEVNPKRFLKIKKIKKHYQSQKQKKKKKLQKLLLDGQLNRILPNIPEVGPSDIPDPLIHQHWPSSTLGAVSESFHEKLYKFAKNSFASKKDVTFFMKVMNLKYLKSLATPGEEVGILSGQSIGEPSTQMTLNTFHLAGKGEVNITLGIPRLRELFQTSGSIKTPVMVLSLHPNASYKLARRLSNAFYRLTLYELLDQIKVEHSLVIENNAHVRLYKVDIKLLENSGKNWNLSPQILESKFRGFIATLINSIHKAWDMKSVFVGQMTQGMNFDVFDSLVPSQDENEDEEDDGSKLPDLAVQNADYEDYDTTKYKNQKSEKSYDEKTAEPQLSPLEEESEKPDHEETSPNDNDVSEPSPQNQLDQSDLIKWHSVSVNLIEVELCIPATKPELLLASMIESIAQIYVIRQVQGVQKATVLSPDFNNSSYRVQTAGINFEYARRLWNFIDVDNIQTNHISEIFKNYGVEAAREALRVEISSVFKVYGIIVDNRYLTLIADYMTQTGKMVSMTRSGMAFLNSPLLKMCYESAFAFLTKSTIHGDYDNSKSPSSSIALGLIPQVGTNSFDILQDFFMFPAVKEQVA